MLELVFTSAKEGLIPGRSGFCSVAWTEGMPQNFVALLENMSGYNALYMPNDPKADLNPVCYSYQKVQYGQNELRILSRIAFAGLDYTGRTNKIAHHIIIEDESELANLQHGPVSAFLCEENFITAWNEPPRLIPRRTRLKSAFIDGLRADHWLKLTGKPQWAGIVADSFLNSDEKSCLYLEYDNEAHREDVLYLIDEIARLLPQDVMADFTFNTYFSNVQNGINCFFRAALPNCPALPAIKRFKAKELISLINQTEPPGGGNSPLITAAVTGVAPVVEEKVVASQSDVYSQQMLELQQMRMQQQTQPPAKKIVYKGKNNNIGRQESSHSQVGNSMSPRIRLLLFTAGSLMLMILIGFGVWVTLELTAEPMEDSAPAQAETPTTICETAQENDNKAERNKEKQEPAMEQAQEKKPQADGPAPTPPKQDIAEKKITEAPTPPKVAPKNQNIKLETKDLYELFKGFVALKDSKNKLVLPKALTGTTKIEVKLKKGWSDNAKVYQICEENKFYTSNDVSFKIHPLDEATKFEDKQQLDCSHILLGFELKENKIVVSGEKMAELLDKILGSTITFYTPNGKFTWNICFDDAFIPLIPYGKFNDKNDYQLSAEEKFWKEHAYIKIDDGNLKSEIDKMERCNEERKKIQEELKLLEGVKKPETKDAQAVKKSWQELNDAWATERKKKKSQKRKTKNSFNAFKNFYDALLYANDDAIKEASGLFKEIINTRLQEKKEKPSEAKSVPYKKWKEEKKALEEQLNLSDEEAIKKLLDYIDEQWRKPDLFGDNGGEDSENFNELRKLCKDYETNREKHLKEQKAYNERQKLETELEKTQEYTDEDFKKRRADAIKKVMRQSTDKGKMR